jgi:hypothetical protein
MGTEAAKNSAQQHTTTATVASAKMRAAAGIISGESKRTCSASECISKEGKWKGLRQQLDQ